MIKMNKKMILRYANIFSVFRNDYLCYIFKDLPEKIWEIRAKIDSIYSKAIELSPNDVNLHIAYALSLWRI